MVLTASSENTGTGINIWLFKYTIYYKYLLLITTQMIITADEIYGSMQHSAFDFAAKKPITHTLMMTISKEISKRKI